MNGSPVELSAIECGYEMGKAADTGNTSGFSWLFLIPIAAAVGIAVPLATKKRK